MADSENIVPTPVPGFVPPSPAPEPLDPQRRMLPNRRNSLTFSCTADGAHYYATVSFFDKDQTQPAEIFLNAKSKLGSSTDTAASDAAVVASIALQYGVPAVVLRDAMKRNDDGSPHGPLGAAFDELLGRR